MNKADRNKGKEKTLMFQVSNALPKSEALGFAQTMRTPDKYYIYLVDENPDARDIVRRESWAVVRYPREGEIVRGCYALWVDKGELKSVTSNLVDAQEQNIQQHVSF